MSEWFSNLGPHTNELTHKRARALIQQGHLASLEHSALSDHLAGCDECGRYAAVHVYLDRHLQLEPARTSIPPTVRSSLLNRVRSQHRREQIMKPVYAFVGVAVLAIIVVGAWLTFSSVLQEDVPTEALSPTEVPTTPAIDPTEPVGEPEAAVAAPTDIPAESADTEIEDGDGVAETAETYQRYDIGDELYDIDVADFNGDELPDVVTPDEPAGLTYVLINDGMGGFEEPVSYETGENSFGVIAADLNGDTFIDFAVTQSGPGTVAVLINSGDGSFLDPVIYPAGNEPGFIQAGDMDGDAHIDLILANEPDLVGLLFNNGDGTFGEVVPFFAGRTAGFGSAHPVDVNGDGNLDIVTRYLPHALVSVLLNDGDGVLGEPVEYEACSMPMWLEGVDVNVDGAPDLVVPCDGGVVSILLNDGVGAFDERIDQEVGGSTREAQMADLNGDGLPDLLAGPTEKNLISAYTNDAGGSFELMRNFAYADYEGLYLVYAFRVVDMEGDGLRELISLGTSSVYVIPLDLE